MNFKITILVLDWSLKSLKIAIGAGKFLNFNGQNSKGKGANTGSLSGYNYSCCERSEKDKDSRPFFALNGVYRKVGNMALKVLEKSLNVLLIKGYEGR